MIAVQDDGSYAPVEVTLGRSQGDSIAIASGLSEGQRVVASGQFLIDSEANLSGAVARLNASRGGAAEAANGVHEGPDASPRYPATA